MRNMTLDIKENYPLKENTTFKIGGPARYFAVASAWRQVADAYSFAKNNNLPVFILGRGSNILVSDSGFPGVVILNAIKGISSRIEGDKVYVTAGAGEDWDGFVKQCVDNNWQGLECLSGIPGTVGAAPVQNIGAYGQSADASVAAVQAFDTLAGEIVSLGSEECEFGYRKSVFNSTSAGRYVITRVTFGLNAGGIPELSYTELKNRLAGTAAVTAASVRDAVLNIRDGKGLLLLEGYEKFKSAGSFFKNPAVPSGLFENARKKIEKENCCEDWAWRLPSGQVKISAACLIQCAGYPRGYRQGNVGLSPRHSLVIVNYGNASSDETVAFAKRIQRDVKEIFGITLIPEVRFIGFSPEELLVQP